MIRDRQNTWNEPKIVLGLDFPELICFIINNEPDINKIIIMIKTLLPI